MPHSFFPFTFSEFHQVANHSVRFLGVVMTRDFGPLKTDDRLREIFFFPCEGVFNVYNSDFDLAFQIPMNPVTASAERTHKGW